MRRRIIVGAILVGVAITGSIGLAPAYAHSSLVASTPEDGETLTVLPERFSVTTNEAMLDVGGSKGFALQIVDVAGAYYGDGCVQIVDATMSTAAALGEPGDYTMLWQTVSADGHSIDGEIAFTWEPSSDVPSSIGQSVAPSCGEAAGDGAPASEQEASPFGLTEALIVGGGLIAVVIGVVLAVVIARRRGNTP